MAMNVSSFWEQVKKIYTDRFKPLSMGQKFLWIAVILGAIVGLSILISINAAPKYVTLVSNLSEQSAGYIAQKLNGLGIPYKAGPNGTIYIPQSANVYEVRMKLATLGALGPAAGTEGYSLLQNNSIASMGMTSFERQVQFQIALAGELERSIDMINAIQYSKVFLSLPKYTYYVPGQEEKPTASVLVILKPGMTLSSNQVLGIMNLIAGAVGKMSVSDVKVVDQYSNVLSDEVNLSSSAMAGASKLKLQQAVEKYYVDKVKKMLYNVFGYGNVAVAANAVLDWQKITQESKTYVPANPKQNTGVLNSQESDKSVSSNGVPSGAPGTYSNIPPTYSSTANSSQVSQYSRTVTNYDVSQTYNQVVEDKAGEIKKLTMTVFLNSTNTTSNASEVKMAVANAIGVPASGVEVLPMPFNRSAEKAIERAQTVLQSQRRFRLLVTYSVIFSLLLTVLFYLMILRHRKKKKLREIETRRKKIEEEMSQASQKVPEAKNEELFGLQNAAVEWVDEDPAEVAQLIKIWMSKE